ncbi:transferase family protein [Penicillium waksmanii]|uniref:transferase family protein n=1 Tax=Penicillium waksmanii TaxID=69791 RepID=UPI00254824D6|nr:transferase family protein [Penicillium waksmanii]KAJ5974174.1 transferase family protein [Penicillium waksmanii]
MVETTVIQSERLFPSIKPIERAVPLSLLDATTADFSSTTAIWLFERPDGVLEDEFDLFDHFRRSLHATLNHYPQWTGLLKSITTLDSARLEKETLRFPQHARRFGRVYAHYGSPQDPGVEFITATSTATIETLCPASRTKEEPLFDRQKVRLDSLIPSGRLASAITAVKKDAAGVLPPVFVIQLTKTACGGFALGAKIAHPLADIQSLAYFVKDWAKISRWHLGGSSGLKPIVQPIFEPERLDSMAIGNINGEDANPEALERIKSLPLHRYDCTRRQGDAMDGMGFRRPVSHYTVHLTRDQVETIWNKISNGDPKNPTAERISRHDAVLAHIWSCITRARKQQEDTGLVHCNLTYGTRPALHFGDDFIGSPTMNINIEMSGKELASAEIAEEQRTRDVAQCIRKTISQMSQPGAIGAHLHSVAFEKAPQRIWQAFLGSRHLIVTSWARVGIYDVDFGLNTPIRFAEGVIPDLDGDVLIKDAPPLDRMKKSSDRSAWTDDGVDVSIHIRAEDMDRLIRDPLLLP